MKKIVIATKNKGKIAEFKQFFSKNNVEVVSLLDLEDAPDIEETGKTFEENAALKAEEISRRFNIAVLSDDSGLIIDALDGRPGIFSARYAGEPTDDKANIRKVLGELSEVPEAERTARFICVLAIAVPDKETVFYQGYCKGTIGHTEIGENGFGYDPIFIPDGYTQTMAELPPEEKNKISHRKNAISQLEKGLYSK
ncbi:non-canonical purine NTP pyrophosphatase [Oceanobacillus arenosus]|uniref:dITP/XTP pyrophosphatase n=1 Tax=Oceanobacillus arenosus TaxID=1229153 RepID=A0A3D8PLA1_9BACI|nr:XTP/dITP diphosphatase [Oceanobacillus arenosus]RDW16267.1 non-canonical purine NTP pyrophosphatase [Oceanobacillus arenosus]